MFHYYFLIWCTRNEVDDDNDDDGKCGMLFNDVSADIP